MSRILKKKATGREEGYYRTGHRKRTDADSKEKESGVVICADRCLSSRIFRCDDSSIYQNKKYCSNENTEKEQTQTEESNNKKADSKKQQKKKEKRQRIRKRIQQNRRRKRVQKTVNRRMLMIAVMK